MKINLNLIKLELKKQKKKQQDLAKYINVSQKTLIAIFARNDCTIVQFEKMIQFLECEMCDMTDFIIAYEYSSSLVKGLEISTTLKQSMIDKERELSELSLKVREFDIVRRALIDKSEIIKLLKEKLDRLE